MQRRHGRQLDQLLVLPEQNLDRHGIRCRVLILSTIPHFKAGSLLRNSCNSTSSIIPPSLTIFTMHFQASTILALIAGATARPAVSLAHPDATVLTKRDFAVVPHSSIKYIPESFRGGAEGNAIRRYEPYLHIAHGCQSYPAVSATGQVGGGLDNTGSPSGGCNDPANGQTYVRGGWHNGRYAIMYAWYFPKDQISAGGANGGHRHDWENVVLWIDNREFLRLNTITSF